MKPWINTETNEPITTLPYDVYGFIYCIIYKDGTRYIGKKKVYKELKRTALQSGEKRPNHINYFYKGKGNKLEKTFTQSDWKRYTGSSEITPPPSQIHQRVIIALSKNKQTLTYLEAKALFCFGAVPDKQYHNRMIPPTTVYENSMSGEYPLEDLK